MSRPGFFTVLMLHDCSDSVLLSCLQGGSRPVVQRRDPMCRSLHCSHLDGVAYRSSLKSGSWVTRWGVADTAQPVAYIQRVIRVSLATSMREASSRGVW